jgi:hypothetical protein
MTALSIIPSYQAQLSNDPYEYSVLHPKVSTISNSLILPSYLFFDFEIVPNSTQTSSRGLVKSGQCLMLKQ